MADKKRVLVACGTGIATSTVVCKRVEDLLKNNGIEAEVIQCKIAEIGTYVSDWYADGKDRSGNSERVAVIESKISLNGGIKSWF